MINIVNIIVEGEDLRLNAKIANSVHIGTSPTKSIDIDRHEVGRVDHSKYLGSIKANESDLSIDGKDRIS